MKKAMTLTTEELLRELASARGRSGTGNTVEELAHKLSWSKERVSRLLRTAKQQGRLAVDYRECEGLDGRGFRQRLYRVLAKAKP